MALSRPATVWRSFRRSLLFAPVLMTLGALLLFALTSWVDATRPDTIYDAIEATGGGALGFLVFAGGASAAQSILGALVGTWATIVGVVFSITLVTIQLSATKYSAQVIPVFERDRLNQVVLGTFTATFVYSLLVLKTVRTEENESFVPLVGTNLAVVLAIVSLFLLIGFIGNLAAYIRPTRFVEDHAALGLRLVPNYNVPRRAEGWQPVPATPEPPGGSAARAPTTGYLARVHWDGLRERLESEERPPDRVDVLVPVGWPVWKGRELLRVQGGGDGVAERLAEALEVEPGPQLENPALVVDSLADVGVTALSGGATDIGVAKSALRGLLDLAREGLRDPEMPQAFRLATTHAEVLVQRRQTPFYALALRASERVLHKAREQGLWDVGEEVARHAEPLLREGARSVAWPEALEWSRGVLAWSIRAGEEATRRRVLRLWAGVVLDLRRDGSIAQSAALARVVEQAAAEAGAGELAREMLEA